MGRLDEGQRDLAWVKNHPASLSEVREEGTIAHRKTDVRVVRVGFSSCRRGRGGTNVSQTRKRIE